MATYPISLLGKVTGLPRDSQCSPTAQSTRMSPRAGVTLMGRGQTRSAGVGEDLPVLTFPPVHAGPPCKHAGSLGTCTPAIDTTHPNKRHPCVPSSLSLSTDWWYCLAVLGQLQLRKPFPSPSSPGSRCPQHTLPGCSDSKKGCNALLPPRLCSWSSVTS